MPRNPRSTTAPLTVGVLHQHDVVLKDNREFVITQMAWHLGRVKLEVYDRTSGDTIRTTLPPLHPVEVRTEHQCVCSGTGIFRGGGSVVNGVYQGFQGRCFPCDGKGWQNRADVIRNYVYWAKYARISA